MLNPKPTKHERSKIAQFTLLAATMCLLAYSPAACESDAPNLNPAKYGKRTIEVSPMQAGFSFLPLCGLMK